MIQNMLQFGSAECFSGQHGELFLKSAVKLLGKMQNLAMRAGLRGHDCLHVEQAHALE